MITNLPTFYFSPELLFYYIKLCFKVCLLERPKKSKHFGIFIFYFKNKQTLRAKRSSKKIKTIFTLLFKMAPKITNIRGVFYGSKPFITKKPELFSVKALFHIKCLFDLNEFLVYDFYNFYATRIIGTKAKLNEPTNAPYKINFFYYIRRSIKIFRMHTLRF